MITPISIVVPFSLKGKKPMVWTQVRETKDTFHRLLEFPGGKVEANETPVSAAGREVLEETEVLINENELKKFKNYSFELGGKTILLMVFLFEDKDDRFSDSGWLALEELKKSPEKVPAKNIEIITDLIQWFQ